MNVTQVVLDVLSASTLSNVRPRKYIRGEHYEIKSRIFPLKTQTQMYDLRINNLSL